MIFGREHTSSTLIENRMEWCCVNVELSVRRYSEEEAFYMVGLASSGELWVSDEARGTVPFKGM
jgi:hypothetical protein